jgi:hypothetical protein
LTDGRATHTHSLSRVLGELSDEEKANPRCKRSSDVLQAILNAAAKTDVLGDLLHG